MLCTKSRVEDWLIKQRACADTLRGTTSIFHVQDRMSVVCNLIQIVNSNADREAMEAVDGPFGFRHNWASHFGTCWSVGFAPGPMTMQRHKVCLSCGTRFELAARTHKPVLPIRSPSHSWLWSTAFGLAPHPFPHRRGRWNAGAWRGWRPRGSRSASETFRRAFTCQRFARSDDPAGNLFCIPYKPHPISNPSRHILAFCHLCHLER